MATKGAFLMNITELYHRCLNRTILLPMSAVEIFKGCWLFLFVKAHLFVFLCVYEATSSFGSLHHRIIDLRIDFKMFFFKNPDSVVSLDGSVKPSISLCTWMHCTLDWEVSVYMLKHVRVCGSVSVSACVKHIDVSPWFFFFLLLMSARLDWEMLSLTAYWKRDTVVTCHS